MLVLTDKEFSEIEKIIDGYVIGLNSLDKQTVEYDNLKHLLDDKICGLNIFQENQLRKAEFNLGNVIIEEDILTCIYENTLHKFRMVKRKANSGEYAYMLNATDEDPFNKRYIGRCFKVGSHLTEEKQEFIEEGVVIDECILYDSQYVVLEEMKGDV